MAQGFTVTTLLLLKQTKEIADTKIKKEKPPTVDQIITECCFGFELLELPWFEDGAGANTTVGGFALSDMSGVGATIGEGEFERMKKILEGEGDGEGETSGDFNGDGENHDGADVIGESEGLSDGETGDGDGEKGSESGDNEEGKVDGDGEVISLSSTLLVLRVLAAFVAWRSCRLYAISPCWPMCLSQAGNCKHNLMHPTVKENNLSTT